MTCSYRLLPLALSLWLAGMSVFAVPRPNVLFILTDDQRFDTIAAFGKTPVQTPHLDRLARSGLVFNQAYIMGAMQGAVCVPSRAMLLTGRTLFRVKENLQAQTTWPEQFARAGYRTFITGKWHNQTPGLLRSFQEGKAVFLGGMGDPCKLTVHDLANGILVNKRLTGRHSVEVFAESAMEFLRPQKGDAPFLCYVALNGPHDPRVVPTEYQGRYRPEALPLPKNFLPQHPFNNGELIIRDEKLAPWPRTPDIVRRHLADYYDYMTYVDTQIGRILAALRESGQYDRTLIVFASDNGLAIGSHGLFGKQNLYEHSMRVPLIVAGPGVPKGRKSRAFCYLFDVFPTLGELCAVSAPEGNEGLSLLPVIRNRQTILRQSVYTAYTKTQRAVRDERWKLIVYPQINKTQLFDLRRDPEETQDLAAKTAHARTVRQLTSRLQSWQQKLGDSLPLTTDHPQPADYDFSIVAKP